MCKTLFVESTVFLYWRIVVKLGRKQISKNTLIKSEAGGACRGGAYRYKKACIFATLQVAKEGKKRKPSKQ